MKIKIVAVSFINSAPLWWGLKDDKNIEISFAKPSKVLSLFKNGGFHLALLPTYEFVKNNFLLAAPLGVLSNGNVKSVLIFHKGKREEIEKIYLDPFSRTSQAMTKYLFQDKSVKFEKKTKNLNALEFNEGQLLIGDKALKLRNCGLKTIDVASLWKRKTNHPALFALWAKKKEKTGFDCESLLKESLKKSLKNLDQIIDWAHKKTEIDKRTLRNYFTKSLFYDFGKEGMKALEFYKEIFYEK